MQSKSLSCLRMFYYMAAWNFHYIFSSEAANLTSLTRPTGGNSADSQAVFYLFGGCPCVQCVYCIDCCFFRVDDVMICPHCRSSLKCQECGGTKQTSSGKAVTCGTVKTGDPIHKTQQDPHFLGTRKEQNVPNPVIWIAP